MARGQGHWLRKTGRVLRWLFVGALVLVLGVAAALQLPPVRGFIRDQILAAVQGSLNGKLELADVRWPLPEQLELSGLKISDKHGTRVVGLNGLMAHLRYRSLLSGQVELDRLELSNLYIDMADMSDERGLLSLFAKDEPKKPEPPPDPNSSMSPLPIVVRELCIDHGELRMAPAEDQKFAVRRLNGCVRLRVAKNLDVVIQALEAQLLQNDALVAQLTQPQKLGPLGETAAKGGAMQLAAEGRIAVGKDMPFDARLKVRNFNPETLRALGVASDVLRGAANLDLHAAQSKGRLTYRAQLASAAGQVLAHGELDAQRTLWLHVQTGSLQLAKITTLELPPLGLALDAQVGLGAPDKQDVRVRLLRGYYGAWPLPEVNATASREKSGRVLVKGVEVKQGNAELTAQGEMQPNGALEAGLRLSVPELSELPPVQGAGLHGGVNAEVSLQRGADELIEARADVRVHQLRTATERVEDISLKAHVSGRVERPIVQLDLKARQLLIANRQLGEAILAVGGGPDRYELSLDADQQFIRADGWAEPRDGGWNGGLQATLALKQGPVSMQLPLVRFVPSQALELTQLRAQFQEASLFLDGKLDLEGKTSKLRLAAAVPDMATLTQTLGQSPLPGRVELVGTMAGELQRPDLDLRLRYMNGPKVAGHESEIAVGIVARSDKGQSRVNLQAQAGSAHVDGKLESRWSQRLPLSAALQAARHDLALELRGVSIAELMDPGSPAPRRVLDGVLTGNVTARGNLRKLELGAHMESRVRVGRDPSSVDVVLDASYKDSAFKFEVNGGDRRGQLLNLQASAQLPLERQLAKPRPWPEVIKSSPWELSTELSERSLLELPMLASSGLEADLAPLRVALHANIGHEPNSEPKGIFESQLRWAPLGVLRKARATCNDRASGQLLLSAKWAEQKLGVELHGGPRSEEAIRVSARMDAAFDKLMSGQMRGVTGLQILAQLHKLQLGSLPWVCEQAAGMVSLTAKARDVLTPRAEFSFETDARGLQWQDSPPVDIALGSESVTQAIKLNGEIKTGGGSLHLTGQVPVDVRATDPARLVNRAAPMQIDLGLVRMPMAALLAPVPAVARVSGTTSGQLKLRGSIDKPDLRGKLALEDVSLTLPRMGQRFAHLNLKASLDGKTLRLSEGKVRDLDGTATLAALVTLDTLDAWRAELNLNARNFPLRKSGVMMGHTDVDARVVADTNRERTQVEVKLDNVSIDLTGDGFVDVQSLEPNPEFAFIDTRFGATTAQEQREKEQAEAAEQVAVVPTHIHVVTSEPLWVRRDDFAVNMATDLTVTLGGKTPLIKGKIDLLRGYISLLGQSFDIKRGRVILAGGEVVDPQLEITAEHDTPGGTRVRVEVKGFVREPQLAFYVNGSATTAGDALLAITGRGDRSGGGGSPEKQVANAAIGMTTGLLTLGARREFGDWIPMLSIDQGNQTRVRVGIEADRFIPNFMRGFVKGAYVEGIVAAGGNPNSGGAQAAAAQGSMSGGGVVSSSQVGGAASTASGTGVLLELMLPKNFVWAGQYGPGQAWSIDLDWRP